MAAPLWRVWVGSNGACYYGNDDGTARGSSEYGTEGVVRRAAESWRKAGCCTRIEQRESPSDPWKPVDEPAEKAEQQSLFGDNA